MPWKVTIAPTSEQGDREGDASEAVDYYVRHKAEADDVRQMLFTQPADALGLYWRVIGIQRVSVLYPDTIVDLVRYHA